MPGKFVNAKVARAAVAVGVLMVIGAVFYRRAAGAAWDDSFLFAIKAMTTSGVPDPLSPGVQHFLLVYLPFSAFSWAALVASFV